MQPRLIHTTPVKKYGLWAVALCIFIAGLSGYGLLRHFRHQGEAAKGFQPQVYDYRTEPNYNIGLALRPMDIEILDTLAQGKYSRADLEDLFPRRPYHVRFVGGQDVIYLVIIDQDRDGTWDERWQLKPAGVARHTIDKSGTASEIPFMLRRGRWVPF